MRYFLVVLLGVFLFASPAAAQVSIGIGIPGLSIGINMPSYPELTPIPDYPVYYAPRGNVNLFFYDGMYWAYQRITGMRAPGTTGRGAWWAQRRCLCTS